MSLKVNGKNYDWGDVDLKIPAMMMSWIRRRAMVMALCPAAMGAAITRRLGN